MQAGNRKEVSCAESPIQQRWDAECRGLEAEEVPHTAACAEGRLGRWTESDNKLERAGLKRWGPTTGEGQLGEKAWGQNTVRVERPMGR